MPRPHLERVLVTGASGTLGYNIVRQLAIAHPETRIHVLMRKPYESLFSDLSNVELELCDMRDLEHLKRSVLSLRPDGIVHCAASGVRPSQIDWFEQITLNVASTLALFEASCEITHCHFIHVSTGLVYRSQDRPCREGDPIDTLHPYGASKAAADCLLRAGAQRLNRDLTVVRPFSFTGIHDGGDRLFPSLLRAAQEGRPFAMSAGTQIRDFCAVQDIAEAIVRILEDGASAGRDVFNLGSGLSVALSAIVQSVCIQLELGVELKLGVLPFYSQEPMNLVADIHLARSCGWTPRTNLAYAVWQLARSQFPLLRVREPSHWLPGTEE